MGSASTLESVQGEQGLVDLSKEGRAATFGWGLVGNLPLTSAARKAKRASVLLVDDEPVLLRGLKRSLSGHDVMTVTRVDQALDLYRQHDFDIVFCDLMMPEANGIECYSRLLELGPEHAARLVLMTGGALPDRLGYSVAEIPSTCLLKPFSSEQLEQLIERALERRR
jgi:CheY-like chemotaxis protein